MDYISEKKEIIEQVFANYPKICDINDEMASKFVILTEFLLSENEKYNLTAIRDFDQAISKHIYDSVTISPYIPKGAFVVDIGSGAGFPALPLAIIRPDLNITAVDSTAKKVDLIKKASELLKIDNINAVCGRAEELSAIEAELREKFDVCVARSVAELRILAEICVPFVKKDGLFISMKSKTAEHELKEGEKATNLLGCPSIPKKISLYRSNEGERMIWIFKKTEKTPPKYPRKFAQIKKKPL